MSTPVRVARPPSTDPSSIVHSSGRPKRASVVSVNYAELSEDPPATSGSARKRQASASPSKLRQHAQKSVMKSVHESYLAKGLHFATGNSGIGSSPTLEEEPRRSVVSSLNFGSAKKVAAHPGVAPKYVTNFVIACEQVCVRDPALLAQYQSAIAKHLPINAAEVEKIRKVMEKILTEHVVARIEKQLRALGPDGAPHPHFLHKSAHKPLSHSCSKCKTHSSVLTTICSECKKVGTLSVNPYVDWREAVLKQRELDEYDAANPIVKTPTSSHKKKGGKSSSGSEDDEMRDVSSPSPSPSPPPVEPSTPPATPNKRVKATAKASPASSSSASFTTPVKPRSGGASASTAWANDSRDVDAIDQPTAKWILDAREAITLRAIQWLRVCMAKAKNHEFSFHGGDIIFLLRNAIFKGRGEVSRQADLVVREMIARWDSGLLPIISDSSEPAHILVFSECLHAKKEMQCGTKDEIRTIVEKVRSALTNHCVEDILRFDASLHHHTLPRQSYCYPCGEFHASAGKQMQCPTCGGPLRMEPDFEFLCESLVWTSLFRELGIEPVRTADASVTLDHILALMRTIRPYRSLADAGVDSYKLMCYFITHLTFVMTGWGNVAMTPRTLFLEEYLFLLSNMDVVIRCKDPELVGEFLQALHILDTPHDHPAMQKGYHFLLAHEQKGKMRGNWMKSSDEFYKRYHAAYCGIIGMAEFEFNKEMKFDTRYNHHFE